MLPQIIIIFSIGIIVVILSKNISKLKDLENEELFVEKKKDSKERKKFFYLYGRLKKRISKEEYHNIVNSWWIWLEKTLRKIRINFLKIDNKIISILDKLREKKSEINIDKKNKIDSIDRYAEFEENKIEREDVNFDGQKIKRQEKEESIVRQDLNDSVTQVQKEEDQEKNVNDSADQNPIENQISILPRENKAEPQLTKKAESDSQKKKVEHGNIVAVKGSTGKEKEYIEAIMKNPIDIKLYWKLGIIYSRRRNYKDAISCFRQITKIDPTYIKAKKKISDLIEKVKRKEESEGIEINSESNEDSQRNIDSRLDKKKKNG